MAKELSRSSYFSADTLVALSTPVGGAIAIVRSSGPNALTGLLSVSGKSAESFRPRFATRTPLRTRMGRVIDDAIVIYYKGPESFTGEDVVEYQIHGSDLIALRLIEELCNLGHRQAMPGEFSFRAVKNGKLSLSQAEAVSEVIGAKGDEALSLALEKLSGTQQRFVSEIEKRLETLVVLTEAGIDFSDQDLDETNLDKLKSEAKAVAGVLRKLSDSYARGRKLREGIRISILGRPNAGKSSFFNALLGEKRAIVSEEAGTTRDVIRESLMVVSAKGSAAVVLADTAGIRKSDSRIEAIGIEMARLEGQEADLVFLLVEPHTPDEALGDLYSKLSVDWRTVIGVLTKVDQISSQEIEQEISRIRAFFGVEEWIATSTVSGNGMNEVADRVVELSHHRTHRAAGEVLLTRLEHFRAASATIECLDRAQDAPSHELLAADLRQALDAVSPLIGRRVPDDILGKIFSTFCIGK